MALSRMIASGFDDFTVMAISGHSPTRMLGRYMHPTEKRKIGALMLPQLSTLRAQSDLRPSSHDETAAEIAKLLRARCEIN